MDLTDFDENPWLIGEFDFPGTEDSRAAFEFLIRYAILAPSPRNSQPWKFSLSNRGIDLYVDRGRWRKIFDRDQRELYISAGCALENLLVAARFFGYRADVEYCSRSAMRWNSAQLDLAARVTLCPDEWPITGRSALDHDMLLHAITARRTNYLRFQSLLIFHEVVQAIETSIQGEEIQLRWINDLETQQKIGELARCADIAPFDDASGRREAGGGVGADLSRTFRTSKIFSRFLEFRFSPGDAAAQTDCALIGSAPTMGLLSVQQNGPVSQIRVGQALERIWLIATAYGVHLHPMSLVLEAPKVRSRFVRLLAEPDRLPQQLFLLGRGLASPHPAPRRPLQEFLLNPDRL